MTLGCATSKITLTGNAYPKYYGIVRVLENPPSEKEFVEIGWVSSSGGLIHEWTHLIEAMPKKAAMKGANAIIIKAKDNTNFSTFSYNKNIGAYGSKSTQKSMTVIAIRIMD